MEKFDFNEVLNAIKNFSTEKKADWFNTFFSENDLRKYYMREIASPLANITNIYDQFENKNKNMLMFGSNNYLGLANNEKLVRKIISKISKHGIGLSSAPLLSGYSSIHKELEKKMATMKGKEDALLFSSGYTANMGLISGLLGKNDLIIYDEYSHASLNDGIKLSSATGIMFKHNNTEDLKRLLAKYHEKFENIFVAFEGLYSMDGDCAPLDKIIPIAKEYNAYTILDDCHSSGILGEYGKGACEKFNVTDDVDFVMGSFSKAYTLSGGFVCAKASFIRYLRVFSRPYMFSTSMPPILIASILAVIEIQEESPGLLQKLKVRTNLIVSGLKSVVEFASEPEIGIIVILIPEHGDVLKLSQEFHERNIFLNAVSYPAVPLDEQRFRISVMATHTLDDINYLIQNIKEVWSKYQLNTLVQNLC